MVSGCILEIQLIRRIIVDRGGGGVDATSQAPVLPCAGELAQPAGVVKELHDAGA